MTEYLLTAEELTSENILVMNDAYLNYLDHDDIGSTFAVITFRNLISAANYVSTNDLAGFTHIDTVVREFDQLTVIKFAYTAYEQAADEANSYDPDSAFPRDRQYTFAVIRKRQEAK